MNIKKLFFQTIILFAIISLFVIVINSVVFNYANELFIPLLLEILILFLGFLWLLRRIKFRLVNPLNDLIFNLDAGNIEAFSLRLQAVDELEQLCNTLKKMNTEMWKKAQGEAELIVAKQVAHDLRGPLACLNLLLSYVTALPENQRTLMRSSIQRITDVANTLQNSAEKLGV